MSTPQAWLPMKTPAGYRVGRLVNGRVEYRPDASGAPALLADRQAARRAAERLNIGSLPSRCTEQELVSMASGLRIRNQMMQALRLLLVDGATWRHASEQAGVSESGILRALRRLASHAQSRTRQA